jgi:hypothetical protein
LLAAAGLVGRHASATRALWLLIAAAGLAGVYFTKSRGGILGAAVGCGVFTAIALILAKRRDEKWFAPALVALPLIGMGVAAYWIFGWEQRSGGDTAKLLDNDIRLYMLGIAVACIQAHPLVGGGSRSFSWESFRHIDSEFHRLGGNRPDMAHNEMIQAATDYGLIGLGLLSALLLALLVATVVRAMFEDRPREKDGRDVWRLGGIAAFSGMLAQSFFSFVFHLIPGAILLGICLGMMSRGRASTHRWGGRFTSLLLTIAALGVAAMLLPAGVKGSRIYHILWPVYFGTDLKISDEARIDLLSAAIRIWPQSEFHKDRAVIHQQAALAHAEGPLFAESAELAIEDYERAAQLHPLDPSHAINHGNLLSQLGRDDAAEFSLSLGIRLQGGMEPGFRGHFSLAKHHLRKANRLYDGPNPEMALEALESAAEEIEQACRMMHWILGDMVAPRFEIHTSLGIARETAGDFNGALAAYDFASELQNGRSAHHHAGVLIGKQAVAAWQQREPGKALGGFIEARRRVHLAGGNLPAGVNPDDRTAYLAYLDGMIDFLTGARVQPVEWGKEN